MTEHIYDETDNDQHDAAAVSRSCLVVTLGAILSICVIAGLLAWAVL